MAIIEDWGNATKLTDVKLNGVSIGEDNYKVVEYILDIKWDYLVSLGEGTHKLKVEFDYGYAILPSPWLQLRGICGRN